jgi:hypothetical protein
MDSYLDRPLRQLRLSFTLLVQLHLSSLQV